MYIVTIKNGDKETRIHDAFQKLSSGSVVKGINTIDSFSFSILPSNEGFELLHDYTTLVNVYNTNTFRDEFNGRVLYSDTEMSESGLITKNVICESYLGFLCDSEQEYVEERNWSVKELLQHIIDVHNSQVEEHKQIELGTVTVTDNNDNIYCGIQRENSWETIKKKLIDKLGGEIQIIVTGGHATLVYLTEIGGVMNTSIAVSKNMKSIVEEKDPSEIVTRLIPFGCKLAAEENGAMVETEKRLDITAVNDGKNYIEDEEAKEKYGVRVKSVEWDDVTDENNLLRKGKEWLAENNKVRVKFTITALDLSLLNLNLASFEVGNYHPVENHLLKIDDVVRIIKKTIDICEEVKSSIEVGENFETLSDIQTSQAEKLHKLDTEYATRAELNANVKNTKRLIEESNLGLKLEISGEYVGHTELDAFKKTLTSTLELKLGVDDAGEVISMINGSADSIKLVGKRFSLTTDNLIIEEDGKMFMRSAQIAMGTYNMNSDDYYLRLPDLEILRIPDNDQKAFIKLHRAQVGGAMFDYDTDKTPQISVTKDGMLLPTSNTSNRSCFVWENGEDFKIMRLRGDTKGLHLESIDGDGDILDFTIFGVSFRELCGKIAELCGHIHVYKPKSDTATCLAGGIKTFACSCGLSYEEESDPAGHAFTDGVCTVCGEVCTHERYGDDGLCLACGTYNSNYDPEMHRHEYSVTVVYESTCTKSGYALYDCKCGDSFGEVIKALGHDYDDDGVCKRCGEACVHKEYGEDHRCISCGHYDPEAHHTHIFDIIETIDPTCTTGGSTTYQCACGQTYTKTVDKVAHKLVNGYCEYCGEKLAHEHKYILTSSTDATCTANGENKYECECGDYYTTIIEAEGHVYEDGVCIRCGRTCFHKYVDIETIDPTCTTGGSTTYQCTICGNTYTEETYPASGHDYVGGYCTRCGEANPDYEEPNECPHTNTTEGGNVIDSCHSERWVECLDCGMMINTWIEEHHGSVNDNGYCNDCGEYVG